MDEQTTGLILRLYPLTETSLIVHWLTNDAGRLVTVAKGARRPKSPFRGKLDLYFLADLSFRRSRRSELHLLQEVILRETHPALRQNIGYLAQAAYSVRLVELVTEPETPIPTLFELLTGWLAQLALQPLLPLYVLAFEIKLLADLGLAPNLSESPLSLGGRKLLEKLAKTAWSEVGQWQASETQLRELSQFLGACWGNHLGRMPAGRQMALESGGS